MGGVPVLLRSAGVGNPFAEFAEVRFVSSVISNAIWLAAPFVVLDFVETWLEPVMDQIRLCVIVCGSAGLVGALASRSCWL